MHQSQYILCQYFSKCSSIQCSVSLAIAPHSQYILSTFVYLSASQNVLQYWGQPVIPYLDMSSLSFSFFICCQPNNRIYFFITSCVYYYRLMIVVMLFTTFRYTASEQDEGPSCYLQYFHFSDVLQILPYCILSIKECRHSLHLFRQLSTKFFHTQTDYHLVVQLSRSVFLTKHFSDVSSELNSSNLVSHAGPHAKPFGIHVNWKVLPVSDLLIIQ